MFGKHLTQEAGPQSPVMCELSICKERLERAKAKQDGCHFQGGPQMGKSSF